jgi:phage terminase large subunit-like protein
MGNLVTDPRHLSAVRERQRAIDEHKKAKLVSKQWLKDQILNHDRIDLLMTEVLDYDKLQDFHMLMWYHQTGSYVDVEGQFWHLALAPRGGGKSTILTISNCILDVLKDPNTRILIASKTDTNAIGFLREIKQKLESPKVVEIFGKQKGNLWNDGEINVARRTSTAKEPNISTVGYTGALASRHFDKIYADDLVDEENSKTESQRDKLKTWLYKILHPTLVPNGRINVIGTRYHPQDIYGILIDSVFTVKNKKGKVKKKLYINIPSLIKKKKYKKSWPQHKKYVSFWPEEFSVKFLLRLKKQQGTIIFNSQMQNDVEAMKGKIFNVDWFQWYTLDEMPDRKQLKIFQGVDLAIKQQENADKFAHCTIGVDIKTRNIYVLDYYNRVTHYTKQKSVIGQMFRKYDPIRVAVEANGYQRALLQDMRTDAKLSNVRAIPIFTDTDKTMRAWKLSAYFERGQVFLKEGMQGMQEHLLGIPDGRYKDLFDALDIAINTAFNSKKRNRDREPGVL